MGGKETQRTKWVVPNEQSLSGNGGSWLDPPSSARWPSWSLPSTREPGAVKTAGTDKGPRSPRSLRSKKHPLHPLRCSLDSEKVEKHDKAYNRSRPTYLFHYDQAQSEDAAQSKRQTGLLREAQKGMHFHYRPQALWSWNSPIHDKRLRRTSVREAGGKAA